MNAAACPVANRSAKSDTQHHDLQVESFMAFNLLDLLGALGKSLCVVLVGFDVFYSGTESIHTSVCNAAATTATATTAATTARFLCSGTCVHTTCLPEPLGTAQVTFPHQ